MILPEHKAGLSIEHDPNSAFYVTVAEWLGNHDYDWRNEDAMQRAIDADSMWVMIWYPNTPICFNCIAAPTFDELVEWSGGYERKGGES